MNVFEKAEILADAGFDCPDDICSGIRCDECPYKELTYCKLVIGVQNLEKRGYDVTIQ